MLKLCETSIEGFFAGSDGQIYGPKGLVSERYSTSGNKRMAYIGGRQIYIETLVYEAFIGPRPNRIFFKDGNRDNLRPSNLADSELKMPKRQCLFCGGSFVPLSKVNRLCPDKNCVRRRNAVYDKPEYRVVNE